MEHVPNLPAKWGSLLRRQSTPTSYFLALNKLAQAAMEFPGRELGERGRVNLQITLEHVVQLFLFPGAPDSPALPVDVVRNWRRLVCLHPAHQISSGTKASATGKDRAQAGACLLRQFPKQARRFTINISEKAKVERISLRSQS